LYPVFCQQILHFFLVLTNSFFHEKSLLSNLTRPCFIRVGVTLASNPGLLSFAPSMPMILPTQRTLSLSLFFYFSSNNGEGVEGGGGVKCEKVESMFNQELTPIGPRPNLILFDPLHCYKKFIHAVGDHHWPRQNIRLVRTLRLWPMLMSTA